MPFDRRHSAGVLPALSFADDDPTVPEFTRVLSAKSSNKDFSNKNFNPTQNHKQTPSRKFPLLILLLIALAVMYRDQLTEFGQKFFRTEVGALSLALPAPTESALSPQLLGNELRTLSIKAKKGDSLGSILKRFGVPQSQIETIEKLITTKRTEPNAPTQEELAALPVIARLITVTLSDEGLLEELKAPLPSEAIATFSRVEDGSFSLALNTTEQRMNERVAIGTIDSSFSAAATRTGAPYDLVDDLVDLFSNRVEFKKDFRPGDRFTIIYKDHIVKGGKLITPGPILAAALEVNNEHLVAIRYVGSDGKERYFNEKGEMLGNGFLRYPLQFSRISSVFSNARFHPVLKISRPHNGVDFAAPVGTPVRAVADASVEFSGSKGGNGNMIRLRHSARYETAYLHLSSIAKGVKTGKRVQRGEVIGAVGMSGLATGPHLHFSFYDNGKYVDPLSIKLPTLDELVPGAGIDKRYLAKVLLTIEHYQTATLSGYYAAVNAFGKR